LAELCARPGFRCADVEAAQCPDDQTPPTDGRDSVLFVLGGPGSGKGTNSQRIAEERGWGHISAGDCLRAEQERAGSEHGGLIRRCIEEGTIVPVEVTCALLQRAMSEDQRRQRRFLIDGFPRSLENLLGWRSAVGSDVDVAGVLFFDCPEAELEQRLLLRGRSSGRADDNRASIRKRFLTFERETRPVVDLFRSEARAASSVAGQGGGPHAPLFSADAGRPPVLDVDAAGAPDAVWARCTRALDDVEARLDRPERALFRATLSTESEDVLRACLAAEAKALGGAADAMFGRRCTRWRRVLRPRVDAAGPGGIAGDDDARRK
jgi:UMP-CMP kinase